VLQVHARARGLRLEAERHVAGIAEVEGEVDLLYAQISTTLECDKAHLSNPGGAALDAESLNAADVYIRNNAHVEGEVRLLYAKISGELDCRKAHLSNPGGIALFADSLNAAQVSLADHTHVEGEVRLLNAQISDQLNCRNAHLSNPGGDALDADGLNAADVFLRGAKVEGEVRLLDAQLSGGLECDGAYLSNPGEVALNADRLNATSAFLRTNAKFAGDVRLNGAKISGQLHLGDAQVEGEVNLRGAKINGTLWCDGAHLDNSDGYVLFGPDCRVGGTFLFRLAKPAVGKIDLSSAQVVGPLVDNLASWPTTLNLRDFSYRSLGGDDTDPSQRLEWLGRSEPFSPDVYTQLAEVYRRSGEEGHAREVAIERERERTKQPDLSPWVRAWRRFFGCTVAYGYKPWRALVGLILSFFFGWFWFALPPAQNVMVHAPHNIKGPKHATDCHKDYPCFSPPVYTLDTLLPIVDLHQESNWEPASERQWGLGYEILTWGLIAVGWILTTAVVASIGSLWRRE